MGIDFVTWLYLPVIRAGRVFGHGVGLGIALFVLNVGTSLAQPDLHYVPGSTRRVSQLTGDFDWPLAVPTRSVTFTQGELQATDLGSSFEHNGLDSMAFSDSTDPWELDIDVPVDGGGIWRPILPPGLTYGAFCVPSHGISVNGIMYVVYTQDGVSGGFMKRSFLIASDDDGATWRTVYQLDNYQEDDPRFVNVYLAESSGMIYMYGSGEYRLSSPTLARIHVGSIEDKSEWRYFAGMGSGVPVWSANVADTAELFDQAQVGEFSCCYIDALSRWVMLYNADNPRGITMRTAREPWGPWSDGEVIMQPFNDQAYGNFMHVNWDALRIDLFSDPGREYEWGGEYGPYLIPRFTSGTATRCELYYTMSSWNPYQVHLMKSVVSDEIPPEAPPTVAEHLGHNLWNRYPADVAGEFEYLGEPWLTTYVGASNPDGKMGWLWQKLPPGAKEVSFTIHGGHGEVVLLENSDGLPVSGNVGDVSADLHDGVYGRVVRRATGMNNNTDVAWTWSLTPYDRDNLVVAVMDNLTGSWGFVSFSELDVKVVNPPSAVADWALY